MKISLQWLRDYISFDFNPKELAQRLTMAGFEVETIQSLGPSFEGIVVGEVVQTEAHPNADKLKICKVNLGSEMKTVVCGAPNVQTGQVVPFAPVGSRLDGKRVIESVSIRGIRSEGMICSERELGLSDDHQGILVLDKERYTPGTLFENNSMLRDTVFDLIVTPNRPDALSHFGISREIGVMVGRTPVFPKIQLNETGAPIDQLIQVDIHDTEKCPHYSVRQVNHVHIGPSPKWLVNRLEAVGMRSINNIVDITNFVMLETGQPLHAFDADLIAGKRILVRCASEGEPFVTLDDQKHLLSSNDLLICDSEKGIALAGVMGGLNSEISERTRTILLESACFHPMTTRRTAKRLGIHTEASQRFERGTDPGSTVYAVNRAAKLISELAGGTVARGVLDVYPGRTESTEVTLEESRLSGLLGITIPEERILSILSGLGFEIKEKKPLRVIVPTFRRDISKDVDLIEEIIRHYGFDKIEPRLQTRLFLSDQRNLEQELCETIRDILSGFGLNEVLNNSLVSLKHVSAFGRNSIAVAIQNPLSPENSLLRTGLIPGLLDSVSWNRNRSESNLKFFEIGRIFHQDKAVLPKEEHVLACVLTGSWTCKPYWGHKNRPVDFYDLKGLLDSFWKRLHLGPVQYHPTPVFGFQAESTLSIRIGNNEIGYLGEITGTVCMQWDIPSPVFACELDIQAILSALPKKILYESIPRYPSVHRDLAFVVDLSVPAMDIRTAIFKSGGQWLQTADPFDLYCGKQIPSGKRSIAFSLEFYSLERTLSETDVDPFVQSIIQQVQKQFKATLRS